MYFKLQDVSALYFFSKNSERILFIIHFPEFFLAPLSQHRVELSKYKADTFDMIQNVLEENTICNGAADKVVKQELKNGKDLDNICSKEVLRNVIN